MPGPTSAAAAGDRGGDGAVGCVPGFVAGDRVRRHALRVQARVQQQARAGAALAVDQAHTAPAQVAHATDVLRVAAGHHQSLLAAGELEEDDTVLGYQVFDEGHVVLARVGVEQMDAGQVGAAVAQRQQPVEAAGCRGRERQGLGVRGQRAGEHREDRVIAADGDERRDRRSR